MLGEDDIPEIMLSLDQDAEATTMTSTAVWPTSIYERSDVILGDLQKALTIGAGSCQ